LTSRLASDSAAEGSSFSAALGRYFWIPILTTVVASVVAYGLSAQQKDEYRASAVIDATTQPVDVLVGAGSRTTGDPDVNAATNVALVRTRQTAAATARAVQPPMDVRDVEAAVTVAREGASSLTRVTAKASSAARAAEIANAYSNAFLRLQRARVATTLDRARAALAAEARRGAGTAGGNAQTPALPGAQAQALADRIAQIDLARSLPSAGVRRVSSAVPPTESSTPSPLRNTAIGGLLGFVLGLGLVAVRDRGDKRIRRPEELEQLLGAPVLAVVPRDRRLRATGTLNGIGPTAREAYRLLDTRIRYTPGGGVGGSVVVTSAADGEGKTTTACYLAATAAARGERVLLFEADLQHPSLRTRLGLAEHVGLVEVLQGVPLDDALQRITLDGGEGIDVLTVGSGARPADFDAEELAALLPELERRYGLVIADIAPVTAVSDGIPLAARAGRVLVVNAPAAVSGPAATRFAEQLRRTGVPITGIVANGYRPGSKLRSG